MKLTFVGVGEAFDEKNGNTSFVLQTQNSNMLIDCGYAVPHALWKLYPSTDFLDAVYISHLHADHYFGIPALLNRMFIEKRSNELTILIHKNLKEDFMYAVNMGYRATFSNATFPIHIIELDENALTSYRNLSISCAPSYHSVPNYAVRFQDKSSSVCYSGDGAVTKQSMDLFQNTDLLVHEGFMFEKSPFPTHATIKHVVEIAKNQKVKKVAILHINAKERQDNLILIKQAFENNVFPVLFPNPKDSITT